MNLISVKTNVWLISHRRSLDTGSAAGALWDTGIIELWKSTSGQIQDCTRQPTTTGTMSGGFKLQCIRNRHLLYFHCFKFVDESKIILDSFQMQIKYVIAFVACQLLWIHRLVIRYCHWRAPPKRDPLLSLGISPSGATIAVSSETTQLTSEPDEVTWRMIDEYRKTRSSLRLLNRSSFELRFELKKKDT